MLKTYLSILGSQIIDFDDGSSLGLIRDVIVDPDTGKIEAFWVKPFTLPLKHAVLQSQDIIEWKKHVYVRGESCISDPAEIIKVADILTRHTYVIGNRVRGQSGKKYGRVFSLDFDASQYYIRNIYVQKSFFGFFSYNKRVFSFDSILEILPDMILLNDDAAVKAKVIENSLVGDRPASA
ncbi:PRC-barrel domain-containing protein [Candidatus Peregrinibacteria bacterium]|nr:PRC-barrel domain-containing protein [Candidatus Peregrinibacteria bacterium]